MGSKQLAQRALDQGQGIFRLAPNWVPRAFCIPGRRIKLHPDDYYAMGAHRGGIDERWFSSTVRADNGPDTEPDEGLSYIVVQDGAKNEQVMLRDAVDSLGADVIGQRLWDTYGGWPMYSKFFDNLGPLPHHIHQLPEHAEKVGMKSKPEAYFFPAQVNNYGARFPFTFFGLRPGTTKDQVKECLANWNKGDNKILDLSQAYRLQPNTGWDVPAGVLHAPGSMCTYEPQAASDIMAMFQSLTDDMPTDHELLTKCVPDEHKEDLDYMVSMLDWDTNLDPDFAKNRFMAPTPVRDEDEMVAEGYRDEWIAYKSQAFCAKQTTIMPGRTVTLVDAACYGTILTQGCGTLGVWRAETPTLIRYGQLTQDEYFVSEAAAQSGVKVTNTSETEPMVLLRHFGPGNPDLSID